ncbi:hypothetical protein QR680_018004 [Steinernema hermaphroditum]|uniref:G-protein coupled receptors family 1 profile domain-containing protein n=1 Tax=Steinernema hermaphroditum TaxID=289476 RepID=A0AA39HHC0_9BILA|nr:hypothetical protein QR680_018004 [Steinernema hermaphroditum]
MTESTSPWAIVNDSFKVFESFLWAFEIVCVLYVINCFRKASLLHYNLKIILINFSLAMIVYAFSRLGMHIDAIFLSYGIGPVNITCRSSLLVPKILSAVAIVVAVCCFMMLTVERTVATFIPKKYEQLRKTRKELLLSLLLWVASIGVSLGLNLSPEGPIIECDKAVPNASVFLLGLNAEFVLVMVAVGNVSTAANVALLYMLHKHNKKRRNQLNPGQLNIRYQYTENILTTRFLTMAIGLTFVTVVIGLLLVSFYYYAQRTNLVKSGDLLFVEQCFHALAAAYGVSFNVVCLIMHRPNKDQLMRDIRKISCFQTKTYVEELLSPKIKSVDGHSLIFKNESAMYFKYLSDQWNATRAK